MIVVLINNICPRGFTFRAPEKPMLVLERLDKLNVKSLFHPKVYYDILLSVMLKTNIDKEK